MRCLRVLNMAAKPHAQRTPPPASPPAKRTRVDEPELDDVDADDWIRAAEEAEQVASSQPSSQVSKEAPSSPLPSQPPSQERCEPKAKQPSLQPTVSAQGNAPLGKVAPPKPYTQPYAGTPEDPLLLERTTMNTEWFRRLEPAMRQPSFAKLKAFLDAEKAAGRTIYPPAHLIHSWSRTTPLEKVKVVIVGQDPYHQPGQACGHCFSVPHGKAVPASLQNIYKELRAEFPDFTPPRHGCLDGWARQGVLLLNACLTVNAGAAGSHHNHGWEPFTREILRCVAKSAAGGGSGRLASMFASQMNQSMSGPQKGVVFLAWGLPAAKTLAEAGITEVRKNTTPHTNRQKTPNVLLLKSPHPSPLSAHRGFLGNGHFAKANAWLEEPTRYGRGGGIRWGDL